MKQKVDSNGLPVQRGNTIRSQLSYWGENCTNDHPKCVMHHAIHAAAVVQPEDLDRCGLDKKDSGRE